MWSGSLGPLSSTRLRQPLAALAAPAAASVQASEAEIGRLDVGGPVRLSRLLNPSLAFSLDRLLRDYPPSLRGIPTHHDT